MCNKNPRRREGFEHMPEVVEAWHYEILFGNQFIRRKQAGIVLSESDLLRFEAELAVAAFEVFTKNQSDEHILKLPIKDLTDEQREQRREILKARGLQISN